jgi:hypothetical protein
MMSNIIFKQTTVIADKHDNAAIYPWVNLKAANFAAQRIALPIACEISCRAWP